MGNRCVYDWTSIMVDMGLDPSVHNDREPHHARIFNAWIEDWESDILITRYQENEQRLLQKYKNIGFFDDEDNRIYMIAPESVGFKCTTIRNTQYCVVGQTLNFRDGDYLELLILRDINDDFMLLIKGVEQDPGLGVKIVHLSIDDDIEATDGDKEKNNNENDPKTTYDGENMNASSDDEGNIDEVAPNPPINDLNINDNSDDKVYDYEVTPDTPTSGGNIETIDNDEDKNYKDDAEKETDNENLNMKANDKETEETEVNEEYSTDPPTIDVNINDNYDDEKNDY